MSKGEDIEVVELEFPRQLPRACRALVPILLACLAARHSRRGSIVIAQGLTIMSGVPAWIGARLRGAAVMVDYCDEPKNTPGWMWSRLLERADHVILMSEELRATASHFRRKGLSYVPGFVESRMFFAQAAEETSGDLPWGVGDDSTFTIGYVGSFWRVEGVRHLIEAIARLSKEFPCRLVVVGGANVPDSDDIAAIARELGIAHAVTIVGSQPHAAIPRLLRAFDVVCSPKLDTPENRAAFPMKVIEYLASGTATVVTDVGDVAKLVKMEQIGYVADAGSAESLARVLTSIRNDPAEARARAQRAREVVRSRFTDTAIALQLRRIFEGAESRP